MAELAAQGALGVAVEALEVWEVAPGEAAAGPEAPAAPEVRVLAQAEAAVPMEVQKGRLRVNGLPLRRCYAARHQVSLAGPV